MHFHSLSLGPVLAQECLCFPDIKNAVFVTAFVRSIQTSSWAIRASVWLCGDAALTVFELHNSEGKESYRTFEHLGWACVRCTLLTSWTLWSYTAWPMLSMRACNLCVHVCECNCCRRCCACWLASLAAVKPCLKQRFSDICMLKSLPWLQVVSQAYLWWRILKVMEIYKFSFYKLRV